MVSNLGEKLFVDAKVLSQINTAILCSNGRIICSLFDILEKAQPGISRISGKFCFFLPVSYLDLELI